MNTNPLKLENQLCFSLYTASRRVINLYKPYLDPLGLTYTQYIVLLVIWEHQDISLKNLSTELYLDSGTLTPLLKKLESAGYIARNRDPEDERSLKITLTDVGKDLKAKAIRIPEQVFCDSTLTLENALSLKRQLDHLIQNLNND